MNISVQIKDPSCLYGHSTFEVALSYIHNFGTTPWQANIIKAKPHIKFQHASVCGYGVTMEAAIQNLSEELRIRMQVAIEVRPSEDEVLAHLAKVYQEIRPDALFAFADRGALQALTTPNRLFDLGWTIQYFTQRQHIQYTDRGICDALREYVRKQPIAKTA